MDSKGSELTAPVRAARAIDDSRHHRSRTVSASGADLCRRCSGRVDGRAAVWSGGVSHGGGAARVAARATATQRASPKRRQRVRVPPTNAARSAALSVIRAFQGDHSGIPSADFGRQPDITAVVVPL